MKHRSPLAALVAASCALMVPSLPARAQASAPIVLPELPAASSARRSFAPMGPALRTPAETANRATVAGERRPERPVASQISIPLGKTPPPPRPAEERAVQRSGAAARGGVADDAARCEAERDPQVNAACRAKATREANARVPN